MGVPRRNDDSDTILFQANTEWTTPLYSCASATRATIKTVNFGYNSSSTLEGLTIHDIRPKSYLDASAYPLWASETGKEPDWSLAELEPLWGIVDKKDDSWQNIEYTQAPHLWLSAEAALEGLGSAPFNLPAVDFHHAAMFDTYSVSADVLDQQNNIVADYTGHSNLAMYNRWKNLSATASGSSHIINLVWTDLAANAVVGTRSWLPSEPLPDLAKRADGDTPGVKVPIYVFSRGTKYHIKYAIPAFLVLGLLLVAICASLIAVIFGRASFGRIRLYLSRVSSGRLMTTMVADDVAMGETTGVSDESSAAGTKQWLKRRGKTVIDVSDGIPRAVGTQKGYQTGKSGPDPGAEQLFRDG
jgi:hypothetical protein